MNLSSLSSALRLTALSGALLLTASHSSQAATITWGAATTISGDGDILNTGTRVGAFNVGEAIDGGFSYPSTATSTTINGVTFDPFAVVRNSTGNTVGNFTLSFGRVYTSDFGSTAAPFTDLSTNYRTLLQSGAFDYGATNSFTLTMSGLTTGTNYSFQWWANDAANTYNPVGVTATGGNSSVTLDPNTNTTNARGGVGQFAIGTFTADSAQQVVTFSAVGGNNPILNGFQLRSGVAPVPEPSTYAMMALGLGALGLVMRRKRDGAADNTN